MKANSWWHSPIVLEVSRLKNLLSHGNGSKQMDSRTGQETLFLVCVCVCFRCFRCFRWVMFNLLPVVVFSINWSHLKRSGVGHESPRIDMFFHAVLKDKGTDMSIPRKNRGPPPFEGCVCWSPEKTRKRKTGTVSSRSRNHASWHFTFWRRGGAAVGG